MTPLIVRPNSEGTPSSLQRNLQFKLLRAVRVLEYYIGILTGKEQRTASPSTTNIKQQHQDRKK